MTTPTPIKEDKLKTVQEKTAEVALIVRKNVEDALARGDKLDEIEEKSVELEKHSKKFQLNASSLQRQMACKKYKMTILIAVILLVIIAIISLYIYLSTRSA